MAKIYFKDTIPYPINRVYEGFKNHLVEISARIPSIQKIEVRENCQTQPGCCQVINAWYSTHTEIPFILRKFIPVDAMHWIDIAHWNDGSHSVDWEIKVDFLPEAIICKGQTRYLKVDSFTDVIISGELEINGEKIPNLPRIIAHKVESMIENFVLKLISPNMTEANRGIEAYFAEQDKY